MDAGTPWPVDSEGHKMESYTTAISNYRKENPLMNEELKEKLSDIRRKGRKPLIEVGEPPTVKSKDFKQWIKNHKTELEAGGIDISSLKYNGMLPELDEKGIEQDTFAYYFRDRKGNTIMLPLEWKNEITFPVGQGNWNPVTEGPTPIPDNPFDKKLSDVTLDDVLSLDKNVISDFYLQNKDNLVSMGLDESLLQEFENIYTEEIEPQLP